MAGQTITISVLADTKKFSNAMSKLGDETGFKKLGSGLKTLGKAASVGLAAVGGAAIAWAGSTAKALAEIERIGAATDAVLKSTGGAAGKTRKDIDDLAASIEKVSGVEAEVVTEGQNMLLTFTGIKGANFDRATSTMTDMAIAMNKGSLSGLDMKAMSIQLGKALNDPIKGITALSKVGVSFTDAQREQITAMQNAGDVAGAQTIILDELAKEFGGAAEAAGGTALGKWAKIKNVFGEISERVLAFLLPALTSLGDWVLTKGLPLFDTFGTWIQSKFIPAIKTAAAWVGENLVPRFKQLWTTIQTEVLPVVRDLASWFVGTLVPALMSFGQWVVQNKDGLSAIAVVVGTVVLGIQAYIKVMAIWKAAVAVATAAQILFNTALTANPIGLIILAIAALVAGLVYFFTQTEVGKKAWTAFMSFLTGVWDAISKGFQAAADWVVKAWNGVYSFFNGLPGTIKGFFSGAVDWLKQAGYNVLVGLGHGLIDRWNGVRSWLGGIGSNITSVFAGAGSWLSNAGSQLINGLWDGISSKVDWVVSKVKGLGSAVINAAKGIFGIKSPSRVFRGLGEYITEGLAIGLDDVAGVKAATAQLSATVTDGFDPTLKLNANVNGRAGAGAGNTYQITVQAVAPNAEVGRAVVQAISDYERINGGRR